MEAATVFREKLRDQGYDGVVMDTRDDRGPIHAVAFDPEQVVYPDQAAGLEVTELTPEEIAALEAQGITFYQSEQPFSRKTEEEIRNSLVKRRIKRRYA